MHRQMQTRNFQDESDELYVNKLFLAKSSSDTCLRSVKFSADGQMTTVKSDNFNDHHLQANLELPELKERCAFASNKELYELSKQLADNEIEPPAEGPQHEALNECVNIEYKSEIIWHECTFNNNDGKVENTYYTAEGSNVVVDLPTKNQPNEQQMAKELPIEIVTKKLKEIQSAETIEIAAHEHMLMLKDIAEFQAQVDMRKAFEQINPFKKLLRLIKLTGKIIDNYYIFTLLLPLGLAIYLVYILYFDVNIYINVERRYLKKMRSSGILLKWFYYVMHLLNVNIF
ncbi:uncharacterized protein LOC117568466 isoform X2 [Drosophila albomicans]|uniref:Uncharacterized protein LOC117568466 isoform X2 n=1 Tax=Drosophila albomicans TaxID=7291 RepID=A0A6P8WS12_DROAB|nr:uncharacterized protein LOC117568466 isoform X2 [Drosophila albomicans]